MAKRLLLFIVFFIASISYIFGQCNKNYGITINKKPTQYYIGPANPNLHVKSYICKGENANFEITNIDSSDLTFRWYKNDTLLTEKSSSFETTVSGTYRVAVQDKECVYNFGNQELAFVETIDVKIMGKDFTICENVAAPYIISSTINFYSSDIKYQWQRDGKDSVGATEWYISPKNSGVYALRATAGLCSVTSSPVIVKATPDNIIKLPFYVDAIPSFGPVTDTLVLCKDNTNNLIPHRGSVNWFVNDKYLGNYQSITPKESGNYYFSTQVNDQCIVKSDPIYISIDTKLPPINFDPLRIGNLCGLIKPEISDINYRLNYNLRFYDAQSGDLKYNFVNTPSDYYKAFKLGKYKVEYETGTCTAEPAFVDYSKHKISLMSRDEKVGGKKITLCNNGSMVVELRHVNSDEVELYKDGVLYQTKPANQRFYINLTESGKYHVKVTLGYCSPKTEIISDTVEIVAPEPIANALTINGTTCNARSIQAKEYPDFSYSWYKNGKVIPDETSPVLPLKSNEGGTYFAVLQKGLCSVETQEITLGGTINGTTNLCQGNKLLLKSAGQEGTYSWKGPNNFTSNLPDITIESVDIRHNGWYFLSFTQNNCTSLDSIQVKVIPQPAMSFKFLEPVCLNNDLLLVARGEKGGYEINYDLLGSFKGYKYFNNPDSVVYINLGKLGSSVPENYTNRLDLRHFPCTFPMSVPAPSKAQVCNDSLQFIGLKKTYCYKDKEIIRLNIPKNIPADTKFKLYLQTIDNKYYITTFSGDSLSMQFLNADDKDSYFYIESENGKYKGISPQFKLNGHRFGIYGIVGTKELSDTVRHCEGFSTKLKAYLTYRPTIQWKKDGVPIENALETTFQAKEAGNYVLSARFDDCVVESNPITVKTRVLPKPNISSLIENYTACTGFSVPLESVNDFPYTEYALKKDNNLVSQISKSSLFKAEISGYYKIAAYQGSCEAGSDSVWIEIGQQLRNTIIASGDIHPATNKILICDQSIAKFTINSYSMDSSSNESLQSYGFSFQWKHDSKDVINANNGFYSTSEPGTYYLQLKQGDCIANSNKIEVIRQNIIPLKLSDTFSKRFINPKDTTFACKGTTINIYAYQTPEEIADWEKELFKDGNLIDSYTIAKNNNHLSTFSINNSGNYSIKFNHPIQKSCAALTDTASFSFVNRAIRIQADTVSSCADIVYLYPKQQGVSYVWKRNEEFLSTSYGIGLGISSAGSFTVETKIDSTCSVLQPILLQKQLKVTLNNSLNVPVNSAINICEGSSINLFANSPDFKAGQSDANFTFEWFKDGQKLSANTHNLNINQNGSYFARVKYKTCEVNTDFVKVSLLKISNRLSPSEDSLSICRNGGFRTLEAETGLNYEYEWFKNDTTLNLFSSSLKVTESGIYKALIQSGECSIVTSKVKIYPDNQLPTASISGDTTLNTGDTANLKLSFTSTPPFTYKLNNNLEGTSEKNTIIHPVKIQEATIFKLASVKNACGEGTVSGEAKVQVIVLANEPLIGHKITVAPVPAESYCEIIFDLPTSQEVSYQLIDMKGQQLTEKNLGNVVYKKQYLNLNHLTAGEYLIRIQVGKDFVTRKLIKF